MSRRSVLIIVTSHGIIDDSHSTGLWFEEFAIPYTLFLEEGYQVTVASPLGGEVPIDQQSLQNYEASSENEAARKALRTTHKLDKSFHADDFDAAFFPGGHGTMFDLPDNDHVKRLVAEFSEQDKVLASICHGSACLVGAMLKSGKSVVAGKKVTAFTNSEEHAVRLDGVMPFLLESRLRELGAEFVPAGDWQDNVVVDGKLVTGQNPQSSRSAAEAVIEVLHS